MYVAQNFNNNNSQKKIRKQEEEEKEIKMRCVPSC